jgi:hypothetical protein
MTGALIGRDTRKTVASGGCQYGRSSARQGQPGALFLNCRHLSAVCSLPRALSFGGSAADAYANPMIVSGTARCPSAPKSRTRRRVPRAVTLGEKPSDLPVEGCLPPRNPSLVSRRVSKAYWTTRRQANDYWLQALATSTSMKPSNTR